MAEEKKVSEEKKKLSSTDKKKSAGVFIAIAIVVILVFAIKGNWGDINNALNPTEPAIEKIPADVILYQFNSLSSNHSQNVELWLINNGEKTAQDIKVFIRARDQTGRLLQEGNITLTSLALRGNETCTADYTVNFETAWKVKTIHTTVEVSWDEGRHIYKYESPIG